MFILLEYAEEGTLDDLFARNDTPYTYDEVRAFWKSFVDLVEGLETVHNTSAERGYSVSVSLQPRKDVSSPLTLLFSVHQDLKPSNIFVFRDTSPGASPFSYSLKIGDYGNSHVKFANRATRSRDGPHRGGSRTYAPPELLRADSIHYQASSDVDVWAMGCIIVEAAVWVVFGERGRTNFRQNRIQETHRLPDHRDLGHGDCFHDGQMVLQCVAQDIIKNIEKDGRRVDTITPAMVALMVQCALTEKQDRNRAGQLLNKMKRKVFARPPAATAIDTNIEAEPIPIIPEQKKPPSSTDMKVFFPRVTIDELAEWIKDTKYGIIRQLPGWDSAKQLLHGREFLLLVDNSKFMQRENAEVIKVVKALSYLLKHLDPSGIQVVCTSKPSAIKRLKTATDVKLFIEKEFRNGYDGNCAIELALDIVLETVRSKYLEQSKVSRSSRVPTFSNLRSPIFKAISILVFTNGKWNYSESGTCGAENPIRRLINEMIQQRVERTRICFHFVRFGDSDIGKRRLLFLDDELGKISPDQR
ncbi:hypothetical protein KJ359_010469 [Pestalotiopsis sp. 9143b]|nr:hypothetical protein KJ359_010469 [Pestalotiopsis sp. 9143b]